MAGKYGTEQVTKIVLAVCEVVNVLDQLMNKKGAFVLFQLSDEFMTLASVNMEELKKEVSELDPEDRGKIRESVKAKLVLLNPDIELRIESGVDIVDEAIDLTKKVVELVQRAKLLVTA